MTDILDLDEGYDICGTGQESFDNDCNASSFSGQYIAHCPSYFPEYSSLELRLRTYDTWPRSLKTRPEVLAAAGLFYTGKGDQTICFQCGGGLKDWEENDDPLAEHVRWFNKCPFATIAIQGNEERRRMKEESVKMMKIKIDDVANVNSASAVNEKSDCDAKIETSIPLCKICYKDEIEIVFLPCRHCVTCINCALALAKCAMCRRQIQGYVRVFL